MSNLLEIKSSYLILFYLILSKNNKLTIIDTFNLRLGPDTLSHLNVQLTKHDVSLIKIVLDISKHCDGHESKPAMCILAISEESQKTSMFFFLLTIIPLIIKHNVP